MIEGQNVGMGNGINDGTGLDKDEGPGVGTGNGMELDKGSGVGTGNRSELDKGQAGCAGLHDWSSNSMFA